MRKQPNFFVVGAPKCGTTSLYDWLSSHPNIYLPRVKEPHFFALLRADRTIEGLNEYLALYAGVDSLQHKAVGDGSTTYLHTPGALEAVQAFAPDAKIVVMLREPVEMIRSLHAYKVQRIQEDVADFEAAWRLSPERRQMRSMPPDVSDAFQVVYADMGLLGARVQHLLSLFPRERAHFILFDDLRCDPKSVYEGLLRFLGVPSDGRVAFEPSNVTSSGGGVARRVASVLPRPMKLAMRRLGLGGSSFTLKTRAPSAQVKPVVSAEFQKELREYYAEDVALLAELIGRDLSAWQSKIPSEPSIETD